MRPLGLVIVSVVCWSGVRGAPSSQDDETAQNIMGYIAEKVERQYYRQGRDLSEEDLEDDRRSRQVQSQQPLFPRLSMQYHNYTSMTTFLRHVSTIYANLTALYSIGQSVQVS